MCVGFLFKFFELALPVPGVKYPADIDAKSDLKLLLEIATNSRLKQGQDKKIQSKQIFYCRSLGKDCFKIQVEFTKDGHYQVLNDYTTMKHRNNCENTGQSPMVIKIYNLMMLKRKIIQQFMQKEELIADSPQTILQRISGNNGQYFYNNVVSNIEDRRKLKKRFDNIINITIKKKKIVKVIKKHIKIGEQRIHIPKEKKIKKKDKNKKEDKTIKTKPKQRKELSDLNKIKFQESLCEKQNDELFLKLQDQLYGRPMKRIKQGSNSSIYYNRCLDQEPKPNNFSEYYPAKSDSLFEQEQQDYFKQKSEINIALNKLNEAGTHNYWPESNNSIEAPPHAYDRMRMDDIFASIRNTLLKSFERKSLQEIEDNNTDILHNVNDGLN